MNIDINHRSTRTLAWITWMTIVIAVGFSVGCAHDIINKSYADHQLKQARETLGNRFGQDLENIAQFLEEPDGLPQHIRFHRGTLETRPEPKWSVGTDTYIAGGVRMAIVWEISAVTDTGDLRRLRLLFQWVTKYIEFDELERLWNEIQDQPEFGADAKQRFDDRGRPLLRPALLPVNESSSRDWYTTDARQAIKGTDPGVCRSTRVWIKDVAGAVAFYLAIQQSMPNTKPPPALPMPGR